MKNDAILDAKKRLNRMSLLQEGDDSFFLNNKRVSLIEIARMREVTATIISSEQFIHPIERLINKKEYENLDEENKMRYILNLCDIYVNLKKSMNI